MRRRTAPLPLEAPLSAAALGRRRLQLRPQAPTVGLGVHRHRRMGQSLEFREFRDYQRGDDARCIDWAASHRLSRRVVRTFEAEEQRSVFILLDCRPAMRLPAGADKLTVALWIAQCLYRVAQTEGDRVIFGTLFGPNDDSPEILKGTRGMKRLLELSADLRSQSPADEAEWQAEPQPSVTSLRRLFAPASAVVLLTDGLFADPDGTCSALAQAAQRSYRSLHVIELDSWPMERALMKRGPFRLGALGGRSASAALNEVTAQQLTAAEDAMRTHRALMKRAFQGPGLVWPTDQPLSWPGTLPKGPEEVAHWFRQTFLAAAVLPSIWSRAS